MYDLVACVTDRWVARQISLARHLRAELRVRAQVPGADSWSAYEQGLL